MSRRWPPPSYDMVHEEGLPHERQFTIACGVLGHREVGTGKSKKLAKRMAAHKMWQALQDMPLDPSNLPETFGEDEDVSCACIASRVFYYLSDFLLIDAFELCCSCRHGRRTAIKA